MGLGASTCPGPGSLSGQRPLCGSRGEPLQSERGSARSIEPEVRSAL